MLLCGLFLSEWKVEFEKKSHIGIFSELIWKYLFLKLFPSSFIDDYKWPCCTLINITHVCKLSNINLDEARLRSLSRNT